MCRKILIVDDEESLVLLLRQALQFEFPDCQVDTAHSGEEALSRLADDGYDLILADYRMPGFNGLELIEGVRYLDGRVPIILMTGYGTEETQARAAELAVDHYVEKPFDADNLLRKVRKLLEDRAGADA